MTRRKIQLVGGSTYSVSLPKEWAEMQEVDPGDEVTLHTHVDGVLAVEPCDRDSASGVPENLVFDVDGCGPDELGGLLHAAYATGVERVSFEADEGFSPAHRRAVDGVVSELTGVTVSDESDHAITVNVPLDPAKVSIRKSVRQLSFIALSMHRNATAALFGEIDPESVLDRSAESTRLHALVDRHFRRSLSRLAEVDALNISREELFALWTTSRELDRVCAAAATIAETARRIEAPPSEPLADGLREAARAARRCVETATTAVVDGCDRGAFRTSIADSERPAALVDTVDRHVSEAGTSIVRLPRALDAIERTSVHGAAIAQAGLRRSVYEHERSPDDQPTRGPWNVEGVSTGDD